MKFIVNGTAYPLHGYISDPSEYTILGQLSAPYYLCRGKDGSMFALYLPNVNEYYPRVKRKEITTMTNAQIILHESLSLMEQGLLKGSGQYAEVETAEGTMTIELPEDIHTFNGWKERGYQVKKGEKSSIKFPIWKHTTKFLKTDTGNAELDKMNTAINEQGGQTNMFMKVSAFFTAAQVEPIKAKA